MSKISKTSAECAAVIQQILVILHKWGIHTLGQLAALDKDDLAIRLGPEAVALWERANGKSMRLLKFVQPAESFAESFEFENEIETVEPLLFMLRRFLEQLSLRLGTLYFVAKELTLQITFSDKSCYEHRFKIPQPTRSVETLFRMFHTHLENFKSQFPITAVSLQAEPAKPGQQQFGLFETALRDPAQLSETLARLTGLLSADRVGTPVLQDTHRPDAFRMEPFSWELGGTTSVSFHSSDATHSTSSGQAECVPPISTNAMSNPALRRFRTATPASVLLEENIPVHLRSTQLQGEVEAVQGPYHSSGDWWAEKAWQRAEWDLQLESGAVCRCHEDEGSWKLDGVYD